MSVIIATIKDEGVVSNLRKILNIFTREVRVMTDEEYRDTKFAELIEEAKNSEIVPEETVKKEFKKRGLKY